MGNRPSYLEFPAATKAEAWALCEGRCTECGKKSSKKHPIEAHHIIPIHWAIQHPEFAPEMIRSLANLKYLCPSCHKKADRENYQRTDEELKTIALALFYAVQVRLI
jgi:5-methylcytosine-specific restriction endonuclease McrA